MVASAIARRQCGGTQPAKRPMALLRREAARQAHALAISAAARHQTMAGLRRCCATGRSRAFSSKTPPPVPPRPPRRQPPAPASGSASSSQQQQALTKRRVSDSGGGEGSSWNRTQLLLFGGTWVFVAVAFWRHLSGQQESRFAAPAQQSQLSQPRSQPQQQQEPPLGEQPILSGPLVTIDDIKKVPLGHVSQHAVRKAQQFIGEQRVRPSQLQAAIVGVLQHVSGSGLSEVLNEVLMLKEEDKEEDEGESGLDGPAVGSEVAGVALKAALLCADRL